MRRRVALGLVIIVAALGSAVAVVLVRPIVDRSPDGEPRPEAFSGLQPLADDLTWVYRAESPEGPEPDVPLVMAIVGKETLGAETAWLFQTGFGQAWATRLILVDRGGDIWVLAADGLEDGSWKRSTFPTPQLFQPIGAARAWSVDYSAGPEFWRFSGTWVQRASGRMTVLGRTGTAWLLEGDLQADGSRVVEIDTVVDGLGLTSITTIAEGSSLVRWDLVTFGRDRGPIEGRYRSMTDGDELTLTVGSTVTLATAPGQGRPVADWLLDGAAISFSGEDGSGRIRWSGRHVAAGLLGTATRDDGSTLVMDFARLPDEPSADPSPVPSR